MFFSIIIEVEIGSWYLTYYLGLNTNFLSPTPQKEPSTRLKASLIHMDPIDALKIEYRRNGTLNLFRVFFIAS